MRPLPNRTRDAGQGPHHAAIFIDYENLHTLIDSRLDGRAHADELITELLDEVRQYLLDEHQTSTAFATAYADFSALNGNGNYIQRSLYLQGADPRLTPTAPQRNASEIQLCVEAMDMLHHRPDVETFVLVTGDRPYLPLLQQFKRYGRSVLVVSLDVPSATERHPLLQDDVFLTVEELLSAPSRRKLVGEEAARRTPRTTTRTDVQHHAVSGEAALRTLEIIEEYFGQYEEVYLTPLLRKLSEQLDDEKYDPKTLINELEEANAVWLEKRRGFPYDYTVLLVDSEHPDVQRVQDAFLDQQDEASDLGGDGYAGIDYDDEDYDDDYVDEYDEDDYPDDYEDDEYDEYDDAPPVPGFEGETEDEDDRA